MQYPSPNRAHLAPVVDLARIRAIRTIEVMERDIDTIEQVFATESAALGFFTAMAGACAGAGLGWLASVGLSPVRQGIFAVVTLVTAIFTAWFFVQWRLARRQRPALLQQLRERTAPSR